MDGQIYRWAGSGNIGKRENFMKKYNEKMTQVDRVETPCINDFADGGWSEGSELQG